MRGVCGQIVAFAFVWFGMRHASQPIVEGLGSLTGRLIVEGRLLVVYAVTCSVCRRISWFCAVMSVMSVTTPMRSRIGASQLEAATMGKKVVQKTDSCGRLTAHPGQMAECTKELVKTHVNIDFGSFLSRRMKYTFADSARRARHSESQKD